jgi:glycosyltransferase involved in cell wall biosynthesis
MGTSIHIIGSRQSGGAEMFYIRLVNALRDAGHQLSAVTRPGSVVSKELSAHIEQDHVGMYNVRDPLSRMAITRIIRARRPDTVQTYMGRATRLTRVPRDLDTIHVSRLGGFYKLDGYRHADAWVGNTRSICDYLIENSFHPDRVFMIPNFVEPQPPGEPGMLSAMRQGLGIPSGGLVILGVGRLIEKKGFSYLIEAFSQLPKTIAGRPLHLLIVGAGFEEKALRSYASQVCPAGRVHWTGWQADPGPYYELADIFVCPSLHEPLGNVILEAWSHSAPVISTMTHGALELMEDGVNGLLVPSGDAGTLSRTIHDLIVQGEAAWRDLAEEGRSLLKRKYGKGAVVNTYLGLYDHLMTIGKQG